MVWTDRMLATLAQGVKGGKWHTLIDKVFDQRNLYFSAHKVWGNKGLRESTSKQWETLQSKNGHELQRLHDTTAGRDLLSLPGATGLDSQAGQREKRPLGIPTVAA